MYTEKGLYNDIDRVMSIPLDEVIGESKKTRLLLPTYYDYNFMQDVMCTAPKNRLFEELLHQMTERRLHGGPDGKPLPRKDGWLLETDLFSLGPALYMEIVSQVVFGQRKVEIKEARNAMQSTSRGLIGTAKDEWCDGMLVRPFEGCKGLQRGPLYAHYGLRSWELQVKEKWDTETAVPKRL